MRRYLLSIVLTVFLPVCAWPQTTGLPQFGSLDQIGLETRNNQDLNVLLAIPIMSSPGRNGMDLNFSVVYNSSIWTRAGSGWTLNNSYVPPWGWSTVYSVGNTNYATRSGHVRCNKCFEGDGCQYIDTTTRTVTRTRTRWGLSIVSQSIGRNSTTNALGTTPFPAHTLAMPPTEAGIT